MAPLFQSLKGKQATAAFGDLCADFAGAQVSIPQRQTGYGRSEEITMKRVLFVLVSIPQRQTGHGRGSKNPNYKN